MDDPDHEDQQHEALQDAQQQPFQQQQLRLQKAFEQELSNEEDHGSGQEDLQDHDHELWEEELQKESDELHSPTPASQESKDSDVVSHISEGDDAMQQDSDAEDCAPAVHHAILPESWDESDYDDDDEEGFDVAVEDVDIPHVQQPYAGLLGDTAYWSLSKPAGNRKRNVFPELV